MYRLSETRQAPFLSQCWEGAIYTYQLKPVFQKELGSLAKVVLLYVALLTVILLELSKTIDSSMFYPIAGDMAAVLVIVLHIPLRLSPHSSVIHPSSLFSQFVKMATVQEKLNNLLNLQAVLLG